MTWKSIELLDKEALKCDKCKRLIEDTIMYFYVADFDDYIDEVLCEECYYNHLKNIKCIKGTYEVLNDNIVTIKNWFPDGDLELSCMNLTKIGKRIKRGK